MRVIVVAGIVPGEIDEELGLDKGGLKGAARREARLRTYKKISTRG